MHRVSKLKWGGCDLKAARASQGYLCRIAAKLFHVVSQPFDSGTGVEQPKVLRLSSFRDLSSMWERPERQSVAEVREDNSLWSDESRYTVDRII